MGVGAGDGNALPKAGAKLANGSAAAVALEAAPVVSDMGPPAYPAAAAGDAGGGGGVLLGLGIGFAYPPPIFCDTPGEGIACISWYCPEYCCCGG